MNRKALLIMPLTVAFAASAWAAPRSWQQAKSIAQKEAAKIGITLDKGGLSALKTKGQSAQADASYYVFANGKDKGYVIVSGDDVMPDIVGYSTNGTFADGQLPPDFAAMLKAYDDMVKAVQRGDKKAIRDAEEAKALRAERKSAAVEPLLGAIEYNQSTPYNNLCPVYSNDTLCVTGCVATAMAQVMAYYKYPSELLADIPAYTTRTKGYNMPAIAKGVAYDWNNILPRYQGDGVTYTAEQANAIATLMLHCGCSVNMDYALSSGADVYAKHMINFFGYDKELVQDVQRDAFTLKQWTDIIDRELREKRPILVGAYGAPGGHEFVLDGADENGLYHINWGWGGGYNNYFDITLLNPDKPNNPSDDGDGYSNGLELVIGITPDNGKVDEPLVTCDPIAADGKHGNGIKWTKDTRTDAKENFEGTVSASFTNQTNGDFTGYFAVGLKNTDNTYDILGCSNEYTLKYDYYVTYDYNISYAFQPGTYELYSLYSTDNKTWKECGWRGAMPFFVNVTDTKIETGKALTAKVSFDKQLKYKENATATVEIANNLAEEFHGPITLCLTDAKAESDTAIAGVVHVTIPEGGAIVKKVTVNPLLTGNLKLLVVDGADRTISTQDVFVEGTTSVSSAVSSKPGVTISGGKGSVTLKAAEATTVAVYNTSGQKVAMVSLKGGEEKTVTLRPGIYIVDKTKVIVK